MNDKDANDERRRMRRSAPEAIAPEAAAEETVAAPEGAPAVAQMVAMAEEAEALPDDGRCAMTRC